MRIFSLERLDDHPIKATVTRTLKPHTSPVVSSTIDATGSLLATGGADGVVKVWDIRGGYATHTLHGHSGVISALGFFTASSASKKAEKSESKSKKRRRSEVDDTEHEETAAYRLASGDEEGKIRIWHLQKRKCVAVLDSHVSVVRGLNFDETQQLLLSGSRDKTVMLWDAATWEVKTTIPVLESVETAGFIAGKGALYTGGETGRLRIWWMNGQEATEDQPARAEGQNITEVIFSQTLSCLMAVHADQNLILHSTEGIPNKPGPKTAPLPVIRRISGTHDEVIDLAYVGGSDKLIAVATNLEEVKVLSVAPQDTKDAAEGDQSTYFGSDVGLLQGHEDIVISLTADWSGHWLATGAKDNTARLWRIDPSTKRFTCAAVFTGHAESLGAVALPQIIPSPDSAAYKNPLGHPPAFLITGSQDKTIKRWDTSKLSANPSEPQKVTRATYTRRAHDKDINALDISPIPSSQLFASASQDRTVKMWSLEDGEAIGVLRGHKRGVWSVKFAPRDTPTISGESGGKASNSRGLVLTGSGDKTVKLWSLSDYSCLRTFEGHTNSVLKVLWMPPASKVEQPKDDFDDLDEDETMQADKRANDSNAKPSPPQIASSGSDGLVKIWDASSGELECTLDNHTDRVWALAIPPQHHHHSDQQRHQHEADTKQRTLISGGSDAVLTFWTDTTATTFTAALETSNQRIEQDQDLQNHIRVGSYREAITLALQLNHPARLLNLFQSVVGKYPPEEGSLTGVRGVDDVLGSLGDEQLWALLGRLRDWNTNARTNLVAQRVLWAVFRLYPASKFTAGMRRGGAGIRVDGGEDDAVERRGKMGTQKGSMKDMLDALKVYTERHYRRWEELMDESWLVEYTLREMDEVSGVAGPGSSLIDGVKMNGVESIKGSIGAQRDVVMLE